MRFFTSLVIAIIISLAFSSCNTEKVGNPQISLKAAKYHSMDTKGIQLMIENMGKGDAVGVQWKAELYIGDELVESRDGELSELSMNSFQEVTLSKCCSFDKAEYYVYWKDRNGKQYSTFFFI